MQQVNHQKNILEVDNLSFSYGKDDALVLERISFAIHEGDYVGLVGPNGSGKTTLLKIILGLLTPKTGSVTLFGKDIRRFTDWARVSYIPQRVAHFDARFPATVFETVLMGTYAGRGICRMTTAKDRAAAKDALAVVGMWEYRDRPIGDLSGGQQQRVFIARALAGSPRIIFLDEPTVGVDVPTQKDFYSLLRKLNREHSISIVLVSHDIESVIAEAMHIICVDRTLVCHSSPEAFVRESAVKVVGGKEALVISHHHGHH